MDAVIISKILGFVFSLLCLLLSLLTLKNVKANLRASICRVFLEGKLSFSYFAAGGLAYSLLFFISLFLKIEIAKYVAEPLIFFFFFLALFTWYRTTKF